MAVTEQQFINAYSQMDADKQQKAYNAGNAQVRSWIDAYNASQNNDYTEWDYNFNNQDTYQGRNLGNWNYWDDSMDRQEQIVSNLDTAYQQNPEQFKDWNTFSQNFNYDYEWRTDRERETMKRWYDYKIWNQIDYNDANNTDYLFNQLMWGNQITGTWAALDSARQRYNNYKYLAWMTPDQIASAVESWNINWVGTEMQDLRKYSPELYAQVQAKLQWKQELDDINAVWESIYNWLTSTETNKNYTNYNMTSEYTENASIIKQYNESLYNKIVWLWWDTAAYVSIVASMLQNPAIQWSKNEVEDLEWEIRKIQEQIYTIWDTARATLWSEAPEDLVSAYISHQTKQLQNQLRTAQNSLLVAQGKLNNQLTEVETMMDAINNWLKMEASWILWWTWEAWDNYDYQTADPERLQQIADNLDNIANSDDVYVFRDRNAFNDYFKYNQRSAAQKRILDDYWNANADRLQPIAQQKWNQMNTKPVWETPSYETWWKYNRVKKAILAWTFAWKFDKQNLKQYWFNEGSDWYVLMEQVWRVATLEEMRQLFNTVQWYKWTTSESWTEYAAKTMAKRLLTWYIDAHATDIKNALDSKDKTSDKKAYLSWILSPINMDTKAMREWIAEKVWAEY